MADDKTKDAKKKQTSKQVSQQKRHRRQWITFLRMCRYGVNSFTRNAWLTIAATAIMTVTLFVVFIGVVSQQVMNDTIDTIRDKVVMSVYLKTDTTQEEVNQVMARIKTVSTVTGVEVHETPDEARAAFVDQNKSSEETLDAVKEATNKFPWTLWVNVDDINDTSALAELVNTDETVQKYVDPSHAPSFAGDRRQAIEKIASTADFAQKIGIIVIIIFVSISTLIIFNTIRMAIFNRREEIQMMKLIGAERSFIRGPFIVEAVVYGFFAAIIASAIGYGIFMLATPALRAAGVAVDGANELLSIYAGFVLLGMIIIGAIIGIVSSLMATHRYLRGH